MKTVNRVEWKGLSVVCAGVDKCAKELAGYLDSQEYLWVDCLELKEIFHSYGVNLKYLPKIYGEVENKQIKKYIHSVMTAKVGKEMFNHLILQQR